MKAVFKQRLEKEAGVRGRAGPSEEWVYQRQSLVKIRSLEGRVRQQKGTTEVRWSKIIKGLVSHHEGFRVYRGILGICWRFALWKDHPHCSMENGWRWRLKGYKGCCRDADRKTGSLATNLAEEVLQDGWRWSSVNYPLHSAIYHI